MNRTNLLLASVFVMCMATSQIQAVEPVTVTQTTEADFSTGQFKATVVTNRGDIMLAREIAVLMKSELAPQTVSAVAPAGQVIYAGSGVSNAVYRINGAKAEKFAEVPGTVITSLLWTGKELLVGTGGGKAGIYRLDAQGKALAIWTDEKVKYVWTILAGPAGSIYAATGPEGGVYQIDAQGKAALIFQASPRLARNILCMAAAKDGTLYAGTDTNGLVIHIDPQTKASRVVLDAQEKEISAIVVDDAAGKVYVSTSDSSLAADEAETSPSTERTGKSEPTITRPQAATNPATGASDDKKTNAGTAAKPADGKISNEPVGEDSEDEADTQTESPVLVSRAGKSAHSGPTSDMSDGEDAAHGQGNAVYCINKDGLVSTIFRRPVTILAMIMQDGKLMLGTGNGGIVYSLSADGDEVIHLAKTEAKQITALAADADGNLYFGSSNNGSVGKIEQSLAKEGTFTSKVFDATQIARWGTIIVSVKAPAGATVTVATRNGNVARPDESTWGNWSKEQPADDGYLQIAGPTGRYMQYRLTFTGDAKITATVNKAEIVYQVGNLSPVISAVTVTAGAGQAAPSKPATPGRTAMRAAPSPQADTEEKGSKAVRTISIQASDPNGDQLIYAVFFRQSGTTNWIKIADKLTDPQYTWDTRTVGDGEYEIKAIASDSPSNPPTIALETSRTASHVVVDNTPPVVKEISAKPDGMKVSVGGSVQDANKIVAIHYSIDSQEDWIAVLPVDGICDSNKEEFKFQTKELSAGAHRIAVKVEDAYGNVVYSAVTVNMGK